MSSTLFPSPNSSITAVNLPWEEDTSYTPPLSITDDQWDVSSYQNHPQLNTMLMYVSTEKVPNYTALRFLSKCTPTNDFTCLCQYLCMDGATQYLSGYIQSVSRASPAPPYLKRGLHEKPPTPPSPPLKPSYSQIVKTKIPPRDPEKRACDPGNQSCAPTRDLPILDKSPDLTRNLT